MKKTRFSESQIVGILNQVQAGSAIQDLCREHGISSATFYKWRAKYGGMDVSMMSRILPISTIKIGVCETILLICRWDGCTLTIHIRVAILNRFTQLGTPTTIRIA